VNDYFMLLLGVLCAAGGGELFVRGTVGIGHAARIAPGVIAATIAAFATSSPEVTVSLTGALEGNPSLGLGDALGSNVVNVALILGLALFWGPFQPPRDSIRRDFPIALAAPVLTAALLFDGVLSRWDGLVLLAVFAAWLVAVLREARRQRSAVEEVLGEPKLGRALAESAVGLALLIAAGSFIVSGASSIAQSYGVDAFVIGATIVALGTSVPELATTIIARVKGHDEVGLGTILGSNIFNGLFIVGLVACITPIPVQLTTVAPALIVGVTAVALTYPGPSKVIDWRRGLILLSIYGVYITALLQAK
jgi:cation:H+ antiporter